MDSKQTKPRTERSSQDSIEYIDATQIIIKRNMLTFGPGANGKKAPLDH